MSCGSSHARAFEFNSETSCIQLNACNSDAFSFPFDCTFAEDPWCSCLRTALEKPLRGQTTGIEQGLISVFGQPGVGNQRTEVNGGTLDLSGIEVGDVIGGTQIKELVPETVAPPGTFFTVRTEYHVTAKGEDWIEFDNVHVAVSTREDNFVLAVLRYDRFDAAHSHGLQHRGRITANGEGQGFVFEYRYEAEEGAQFAAIEPSDLSPGTFNVRLVISLFTEAYPDAAGAYALPDSGSLEVSSTIRKVVDSGNAVANPDEILPLGTTDLCQVIEDPNPDDNVFPEPSPCKEFEEEIDLVVPGANRPPVAEICATDPALQPLVGNQIFIDCGEGRAILRGGESTDGDLGSQGLSYLWEVVEEPDEGAASIPAESATFKDVEVSFFAVGDYVIRLTVDDGQAENNTDSEEVVIRADEGFGENLPPEITRLSYRPAGPDTPRVDLLGGAEPPSIEIEASGGVAEIVDLAVDADTGADGCVQGLTYLWSSVSGPAPVEISTDVQDETNVRFTTAGEYVLRITVDDGAPANSEASVDIVVNVTSEGVGPFLRGDCNGDGSATGITDAVFHLGFNFLGTAAPPCPAACDANGDGSIAAISDAIYLLAFSFLGGPAPVAPFDACGTSSTSSDLELGCDDPSGCL